MNHIIPIFCLICLFGALPESAMAESDTLEWQEVRNSEGIQIYTAKAVDTPIIKVKAVALIDASLNRVLAILDDETQYPKWVPYLSEAKLLQTVSTTEKLVYNLFDAPWPASNRDFVYRVVVSSQTENTLSYVMQSEPNSLMPEQKGVVRASLLESVYSLTSVSDNQTRVELVFHADPRGHLPIWVVNIVHRSFPYGAIKGLRAVLHGNAVDEE